MKTICIYHSRDLDGWMSAAIVKKWFLENNDNVWEEDLNNPTLRTPSDKSNCLYFLGWDYGDEIPDLSKYDKVIMCDVSFPPNIMFEITGKSNFIWIDHHVSAIKAMEYQVEEKEIIDIGYPAGLRNTKFAACELTWMYFFPTFSSLDIFKGMPEIVRLLGRYDCFGHKFTQKDQDKLNALLEHKDNAFSEGINPVSYDGIINDLIVKKREEQRILEFQYGARQCISNYEEAYEYLMQDIYNDIRRKASIVAQIRNKGRAIYQYLCSEAKQTYTKAFEIKLNIGLKEFNKQTQKEDYYGNTYKFLCVNQERFNPINFGIDYHKEGYDGFACFWYKDGMWNFSLYNDNEQVDCSKIAKQYGGGGHKGAAGFVVKDLKNVF